VSRELPSIQVVQSINLLLLTTLGYLIAHIYLVWYEIVFLLLFGLLVEWLLQYLEGEHFYFSFSAVSTVFGVMLMMVSSHFLIYLVVITLALMQKRIQYNNRHIFNPSNFALVVALLLFYSDSHLVLGQLGDEEWLGIVVIILGVYVLYRAYRWMIPLAFLGSYIIFQYIGIVQSDPILLLEDIWDRLYSVSFLVFTLFMLTDPRTTPDRVGYQALFGMSIALVATMLDYCYGFRIQHLFLSLFLNTVLSLLCIGRRIHIFGIIILILTLGAIIYIQIQPPYYFEMGI